MGYFKSTTISSPDFECMMCDKKSQKFWEVKMNYGIDYTICSDCLDEIKKNHPENILEIKKSNIE